MAEAAGDLAGFSLSLFLFESIDSSTVEKKRARFL